MTQKTRRIGVYGICVMMLGMMLGGCASSGDQEMDALLLENAQLRQRNSAKDTQLALADERISELEMLLQEAEMAQPLDGYGDTGFEGISGVGASRDMNGQVVLAIAGDVLFASGSASLRSDAKRSLERVAQVIAQQYTANQIRVEGYTDSDPIRKSKWKSNEHLSYERAAAVEAYLVTKGVDNDRIYSAAFGPANPRGSKQESRRVEIVILSSSV